MEIIELKPDSRQPPCLGQRTMVYSYFYLTIQIKCTKTFCMGAVHVTEARFVALASCTKRREAICGLWNKESQKVFFDLLYFSLHVLLFIQPSCTHHSKAQVCSSEENVPADRASGIRMVRTPNVIPITTGQGSATTTHNEEKLHKNKLRLTANSLATGSAMQLTPQTTLAQKSQQHRHSMLWLLGSGIHIVRNKHALFFFVSTK
jgi:hypothetical protein